MSWHPGRPEYAEGAGGDGESRARGLARYMANRDWVIDGIRNDRALRRDVMDRADGIVYLALPLVSSELHVFKRRLRRGKPITLQFVRGRIRKARKHRDRSKAWEADLEPHAAKTVRLRSHREIDRYLASEAQ